MRNEVSGSLRDASYQDISILLPNCTGVPALDQALGDPNVPYRMESKTLVAY